MLDENHGFITLFSSSRGLNMLIHFSFDLVSLPMLPQNIYHTK